MTGCTPLAIVRHAAPRPRRAMHYHVARRAHHVAAHHPATGHPVPHARLVHHPRPHPRPPATACTLNPATPKLAVGKATATALLGGAAAVGAGGIGLAARHLGGAQGSVTGGAPWAGPGGVTGGAPGGLPGGGTPGGPPSGGPGAGGSPIVITNSLPGGSVSVPEPSSLLMLGAALLLLGLVRLMRGSGWKKG